VFHKHYTAINLAGMDPLQDYEKPARRASLTSNPSLAIGVDLEKEWNDNLEKKSTSESSSIQEPEKLRTRDTHHDDSDSPDHDVESTPVHRVVTAQDWTGPNDPENPHNWSIGKRVYHTVPPALFAFVV
jgi:hypothetical protein